MKSFYHAVSGIVAAFLSERNLRVHFSVANLIIVFACFYGITRAEWAILILIIAAMFTSELLNTGIEKAVDTATLEKSETAKFAKDAAAGAVLVMAIAAIFAGVCIFGDSVKIARTLKYIFTAPKVLIPCLMLGVCDLMIIFGGKNDK